MTLLQETLDLIASQAETLSDLALLEELQHTALFHDWNTSLPVFVGRIGQRQDIAQCGKLLENFRSRSHSAMPKSAGAGLWLCRRVYTDSCILSALVQELLGQLEKAISTLDYAFIIAGAAGPAREETIHVLIHSYQARLPKISTPPGDTIDASPRLPVLPLLPSSSLRILEITAPSFLSFQTVHSQQPFIVRNYAREWPALNKHPWRRARYLRSVAGPSRVVPVEVGNSYLLDSWKQVIMSWDDFLTSIDFEDQSRTAATEEVQYLAQHDLFKQFPALQDDVVVPDYAYASLTSGGRRHVPPSNESQLVISSWLGPLGTLSPAHTDPYHNLYVQIVGRKTVWIAPPTQSVDALMCSSDSSTLQNTSRVDVFAEEVDGNVASRVRPHSMCATLEPGDLLFFPAGWWHAMRSESTSFSVSFWF